MIILVGNQKGGVGKSTTAVNLSALFVNRGIDVMLVDADRQATATRWIADRKEAGLPTVHSVQKYDDVGDSLKDLSSRYQMVIVDAAGRDSRELRTGMLAADILLVPFKPSQPDLDTLPTMRDIITQAKDFNSKLAVYGLLNIAPTNHRIKEIEQSKEVFEDYPVIMLLDRVIYERKVYRDAISEGKGVTEMQNMQAVREFEAMVDELISLYQQRSVIKEVAHG